MFINNSKAINVKNDNRHENFDVFLKQIKKYKANTNVDEDEEYLATVLKQSIALFISDLNKPGIDVKLIRTVLTSKASKIENLISYNVFMIYVNLFYDFNIHWEIVD
jgi:hypothetical protein